MKTKLLTTLLICSSFAGCSAVCDERPTPTRTVVAKQIIRENDIHGTVNEEWAETMHDTIKVPGQIDPTNTYYRAPHQTVVEIRPGKFSDTHYDNERK